MKSAILPKDTVQGEPLDSDNTAAAIAEPSTGIAPGLEEGQTHLAKRVTDDGGQDESKLLHGKKLAVAFAGMLLTL